MPGRTSPCLLAPTLNREHISYEGEQPIGCLPIVNSYPHQLYRPSGWPLLFGVPSPVSPAVETGRACQPRRVSRSIYSSLSKVEEGVHGHEKASKRLVSLQAMSPTMERQHAAPPPDFTHYKV